jgi:hypothetical protein
MDNTNRYLIVRDSQGEVQTDAYYASAPDEAFAKAREQAINNGGRWLVCAILDEARLP